MGVAQGVQHDEVVDDALEGDTHRIDTAILKSLRHPDDISNPLGPRWLEEMMRDFTGLGGIAAGIAGVMILARTTAGSSTHGTLYELDAIAAVVVGGTLLIGGRGTIVGTVLGVLIFSTLTNVFTQNNLNISVQSVIKGAIIVIAVLLQQRFAARSSSS